MLLSKSAEKIHSASSSTPKCTTQTEGTQILKNFVVDICGCTQDWTPDSFIDSTVKELKVQLGNDKVVLWTFGDGVDSTVAGVLLQRAIGDNLTCIFVNNGLLSQKRIRKRSRSIQRNEAERDRSGCYRPLHERPERGSRNRKRNVKSSVAILSKYSTLKLTKYKM